MDNSWTYNNIYSRFVKIYAQSDFEVIVDKVTGVNYLRIRADPFQGVELFLRENMKITHGAALPAPALSGQSPRF